MTIPDLAVQDVIETLDSFYCHNVLVGLWADAVANRLEGMAIYLLSDEHYHRCVSGLPGQGQGPR
jgi:hypothetical protein